MVFVDSKFLLSNFSERFNKIIRVNINFSSLTGTLKSDLELSEVNCDDGTIMDSLFDNLLVIIEDVVFKFELVSLLLDGMLLLKLVSDS